MALLTILTDFLGWPADSQQVVKRDMRTFGGLIIGALRGLPPDLTPYPGQVMVVRADGQGFSTASQAGSPFVDFAGCTVRGFDVDIVAVVGNTTLTDAAHRGRWLDCSGASAVDLTIGRNADPTVGVSDNFTCYVLRAATAGAVRLLFAAPLTNGNANGDIHVTAGTGAQVIVPPSRNAVYFLGGTEA